jgi:eukaryotic-like serine/threonine-protein kinase
MSAVSGEAPRSGRYPVLAKYDVLEELGHGGMATVYRAHDRRLGRDVAVKVIHPHLRDSGEVARRFSIEAQAVAKLRHPNIVEVFDVSAEGEGEQYLVVELLRDKTLRKILQSSGALPPEVAAAIGVELLGALSHAHTHGVVHRDVKPENVIIEHRAANPAPETPGTHETGSVRQLPTGQPGDRMSIKLTDFGIAKLLDVQGMTSTGQVLGSPAHMAPEQIEGQDVDARSDVFGMGVLLYECMVGHLPFEGNNPAQVLRRVLDGVYASPERERPTIGRAWSQILDKALGRTPAERYDDAGAMRDAIVAELTRLGVTSPRGELEAYSDDPEGFTARHDKAMIALLCERALASRKRGNAMAAAADYNRALAYAPHDPSLLRIVSSLHGAEARRRFLRRAAPLGLGTLLLGAAAFGVTKELRSGRIELQPDPSATYVPVSQEPGNASTTTSAEPSVTAAVTTTTPKTTAATQTAKPAVPKVVNREVRFNDVAPNNIVQVAIDDGAPTLIAKGQTIALHDDQEHVLKFTCKGDYCKPEQRTVEAGDAKPALSIRLALKDARLVIHGVAGNHYALSDEIQNKLSTEVPNSIAMVDPTRFITVIELESSAPRSTRVFAGKTIEVSFGAGASP